MRRPSPRRQRRGPRRAAVVLVLTSLVCFLAVLATMAAILTRTEQESLQLERELERFSLDFMKMNSVGYERLVYQSLGMPGVDHFYASVPETKLNEFQKKLKDIKKSGWRFQVLDIKRHYRLFRRAYEDVVTSRRDFFKTLTAEEAPNYAQIAASNKKVDDDFKGRYQKFLRKLRRINRRSLRGLIATVAVFATALGLALVVLAAISISFFEVILRRCSSHHYTRDDDDIFSDDEENGDLLKKRRRSATSSGLLPAVLFGGKLFVEDDHGHDRIQMVPMATTL